MPTESIMPPEVSKVLALSSTVNSPLHHRRASLTWNSKIQRQESEGKRVQFSYEMFIREFDPEEAPHACNPSPFLEFEEEPAEDGTSCQRFRFVFTACDEGDDAGPFVHFNFDTVNPEWTDMGNGVRSRLLCIRYVVNNMYYVMTRGSFQSYGCVC